MEAKITLEDVRQAEAYPSLGPAYFVARRIAENVMKGVEAEHFEPLIKKFSDELYDKIREATENFLTSDAESNVQSHIYHLVDQMVHGLLSGEKWIMDRYVLGEKHDCEKVRATVAKHIEEPLAAARIKDLEDQVERLRKDIKWLRR